MFIIYLGAMGSRAVKVNNQRVLPLEKSWFSWLVVSTPPKNMSQLGLLFPINGKIKNVPHHQPVSIECIQSTFVSGGSCSGDGIHVLSQAKSSTIATSHFTSSPKNGLYPIPNPKWGGCDCGTGFTDKLIIWYNHQFHPINPPFPLANCP